MKRYVVDRIEGEIAVCENEDMTFVNINISALPEGIKSGDCITEEKGVYSFDEKATENKRREIDSLLNDIFN